MAVRYTRIRRYIFTNGAKNCSINFFSNNRLKFQSNACGSYLLLKALQYVQEVCGPDLCLVLFVLCASFWKTSRWQKTFLFPPRFPFILWFTACTMSAFSGPVKVRCKYTRFFMDTPLFPTIKQRAFANFLPRS